jgi:hypothetical protein
LKEFRLNDKDENMIRKIKGKYVVLSETTGRKFGTYNTRKEAEKRLKQVEFFKHVKSGSNLRKNTKKQTKS